VKIDLEKLLSGDRRQLARAITLVESSKAEDKVKAQELLQKILPHTGNSKRIGISGVPGVGKSTFIETFGLRLIEQKKKVAVLAIDPSSPVSGGSILSDKTRMERLSREENAFIRPSPTAGELGGVAAKTREAILLCEASGHDTILIETVGVGQSEIDVSYLSDLFIFLALPNAGDEIQGIKKGILELTDLILVNKSEGEMKEKAELSKAYYQNALHLLPHKREGWPQVECISALKCLGFEELEKHIEKFFSDKSFVENKRQQQDSIWLEKLLKELLWLKTTQNDELKAAWADLCAKVANKELTVFQAVTNFGKLIFKV
jgi:LAO/AO transport system kinase